MDKINRFQLYCMLSLMAVPMAFLIVPRLVAAPLENNAWLAIVASLIPGSMVIYIYAAIIKKSRQPFPVLLEEHLGRWGGKAVAILYIPFFILASSFALRLFVDFIETNVLPGTPISVFIGLILVASFAGIKSGLVNIARMIEIISYVGFPFTLLMLFLTITHNHDFSNLQPFGYMSGRDFAQGLQFAAIALLNMMPVLTLGYHFNQPQHLTATMIQAMVSYVLVMLLTTLATIVVLGGENVNLFIFPTFVSIRLISIGDFIQNIDIIFIGIWILGIFGVITIWWFMTCYTIQKVFHLHDYRFLAAPTALIIGVGSVMLSPNILELNLVIERVLPPVYGFFLLLIPLLIFIITLFKRPVEQNTELESPESVPEAAAKQ